MRRYAKGALWVNKDDPKKIVCHIPAVTGYRVIEGPRGPQILRTDQKVRMSKKDRRRLRIHL